MHHHHHHHTRPLSNVLTACDACRFWCNAAIESADFWRVRLSFTCRHHWAWVQSFFDLLYEVLNYVRALRVNGKLAIFDEPTGN
jgi:hypothetical protein